MTRDGAALVLVSRPESVPGLRALGGRRRVLAVTARAARALAHAGIEASLLDEEPSPGDDAGAERFARDAVTSFARLPGGEDASLWHGLSLASLIEWEVWWSIAIPAARFVSGLHAAWRSAGAGEVLHDLPAGSLEADLAPCVVDKGRLRELPPGEPIPFRPDGSLTAPAGYTLAASLADARALASGIDARSIWNALASTLALGGGRRSGVLLLLYTSILPLLDSIAAGDAPELRFLLSGGRPPRRLLPPLARQGVTVFKARTVDEREAAPVAARLAEALTSGVVPGLRFEGLDLAPALGPRLARVAAELPWMAALVSGTEAALRAERVELVVAPSDTSVRSRICLLAAERLGIPTLVVLHGIPGHFYENRIPQHLAVFSEPIRRTLEGAGLDPARLEVVATPHFSRLRPGPPPREDAPLLVLTAPRVTTFTRAVEWGTDGYLGDVLSVLDEVAPERAVTFKLHPCEVPAEYEELLAAHGRPVDGKRTRLVHRADIAVEIERARAVVGPFSTAALETTLLGRSYVAYRPPRHDYPPPFDRGGAAEPCFTRDELASALRDTLRPGARQRAAALREWAGTIDPGASEILALIRRLRGTVAERATKLGRALKLLAQDPGRFYSRVFGALGKDYRRRWRMTLAQWLLHHQREIVFDKCTWMGVRALKNPLDAWIYQEILHDVRPDVVIEIGSCEGGTTLYFAHLLDLLKKGTVVSIDIDRSKFHVAHERILALTGDSLSPEIRARVAEVCAGKSVLVLHDGDHSKAHVLADLEAYAPLVTEGSYFIVEDGIADIFAPGDGLGTYGEGPLAAIEDFLPRHPEFAVDAARERYVLTYNPKGFLRRVR